MEITLANSGVLFNSLAFFRQVIGTKPSGFIHVKLNNNLI